MPASVGAGAARLDDSVLAQQAPERGALQSVSWVAESSLGLPCPLLGFKLGLCVAPHLLTQLRDLPWFSFFFWVL